MRPFRTSRPAAWTLAMYMALCVSSFASVRAESHEGHQPDLPRVTAPEGAVVYIISPKDGARVSSPVTILFGLKGMGVGPAGLDNPKTGHHHLIVDAPLPDLDLPIPADENHIHFGGGQTEVTLDLAPGEHTLQLVLGDLNHIPHTNPVISKPIKITVE